MPTRRTFLKTAAVSTLIAGALSAQASDEPKKENAPAQRPDGFYVGAVSVDSTPDRPVVLPGQHYTRVSDGVRTPVEANILAMESVRDGVSTPVIYISLDAVGVSGTFGKAFWEELKKVLPDINPEHVNLSCTHTHTGTNFYGDPKDAENVPNILKVAENREFVLSRIMPGVKKAWDSRVPARYGFGLGFATLGSCRGVVFEDGTTRNNADPTVPTFRGLETQADSDVNILCFWNEKDELIAMVLNVACPSQCNESTTKIDADYWGDLRPQLKEKYGKDAVILGFCSAAGDQTPGIRYRKAAEIRMQKLRGVERSQEMAHRLYKAVEDVYDLIASDKKTDPIVKFEYIPLDLPGRIISDEEHEKEVKSLKEYEEMFAKNPTSLARGKIAWLKRGVDRWERQQKEGVPTFKTFVTVMRLGELALCTNTFELYLDYGIQIKGRSKAMQTFMFQLTMSPWDYSGYLPTAKGVRGGGYGAVPACNSVGPEGGQMLVEETLAAIAREFEDNR